MSKPSNSVLLAVVLAALAAFGCQSDEDKANENAIKSRDAQFQQMGGHGTGAPSRPAGPPSAGGTPPSGASGK
jgi:hypothetical protein